MTNIQAENVEIRIDDGVWRLYPFGEHILSPTVIFEVRRGGGRLEYSPEFAEQHRLPGTVLSMTYVQAAVLGFEEKSGRWRLGLHLTQRDSDKAHWVELVCWPPADNALYASIAQQAARDLAEYLGCPLRIFGAKKPISSQAASAARSGVTGPLVPHRREDIGPQRVKLFAQSVRLPIQYPGMWLGPGRSGVTLRLAKDMTVTKRGGIAPSFNQCVVDPEQGVIRLLPPTGLLGAFFGGQQARELRTADVRNVEVRHTLTHDYVRQQEEKDVVTEVTYTLYSWEVYLTLPDESLLLAQTTHRTSSELSRKRSTVGDKFSVDTKAGIEYLRQHQADQEAYEAAETFARTVAIVIASMLDVAVVKTQIENEVA